MLPTAAHFEYAMQRVSRDGVKYTANAGDPELRAALAAHYAYPGLGRTENVCITAGSQEAMYVVLMTLLDPAVDELLVVEPAFPSYVKMATLGGVRFVRCRCWKTTASHSTRTASLPESVRRRAPSSSVRRAIRPRACYVAIRRSCSSTRCSAAAANRFG